MYARDSLNYFGESSYLSPVFHIGLSLHQQADHLVTTLETGQRQRCVPIGLNLQAVKNMCCTMLGIRGLLGNRCLMYVQHWKS